MQQKKTSYAGPTRARAAGGMYTVRLRTSKADEVSGIIPIAKADGGGGGVARPS